MSPKRIDKEQRKQEIALVALDLFAEKGLDATSISEVAKLAGIGKGTIYEYFASKDELILTAFVAWMEQIIDSEMTASPVASEDVEERFRTAVRAMVEPFTTDERMIKITLLLFQAMLQNDSLLRTPQARRLMQGMRTMLADLLLEGVARGVFRPNVARDAGTIAINLFAYLDGIVVHYFISNNDFDVMKQVNFYLDRLLNDIRSEPCE